MLSIRSKLLTFCCALFMTLPVWAQGYTELSQPVETQVASSKIEVAVIFSYTCPYCFQLEPLIQAWELQQAEDVEVVHLPAAFNPTWQHFARVYYIAEALDLLDQAHMAIFEEIHVNNNGNSLASMNGLKRFFARFGVEGSEVESLYSSFGVESYLRADFERLRASQIRAVPALMIDGRYIVDGRSAQGLGNMLRVTDQLISQIRAER